MLYDILITTAASSANIISSIGNDNKLLNFTKQQASSLAI